MTRRQISCVAVLFLACLLAIVPAAAAENTTVHDAATQYYNTGTQLLSGGDYAGAIQQYDMALASNTSMIKVSDALLYTYQNKAYALIQLGNYTDAIVTLNTGLAEYPKDTLLWNNKGYAQYSLGNYKDAVDSYNQALAIDGNYTGALINKGDALAKMENFQDAAVAYQAALTTNPNDKDTAAKLAAAQKSAASSTQTTLVVLVVILIVVAAGVAYYVTRKGNKNDKKAGKAPDKKDEPKKNKK